MKSSKKIFLKKILVIFLIFSLFSFYNIQTANATPICRNTPPTTMTLNSGSYSASVGSTFSVIGTQNGNLDCIIEFQDNTSGSYAVIPTTDTDLDCNGATCSGTGASVTKTLKCESAGTYNIKSYNNTASLYSSASTVTCTTTSLTSVSISGTAQVGSVLTATVAPGGATATYQWKESTTSGGTYSNISGATSSTYTPVSGDVGMYIEVVATGTGSYSGTVTSSPTGAVTSGGGGGGGGSLSCSITTAAACSGTVILRMSGSVNAHAELPSMSTPAYNNNVVCCTGITAMGNSCSGNYAVIARLSGTSGTNSHVEENSQTNTNYNTEKACLSSSSAGDEITIGYQTNNCNGYNTTLFSMDKFPTNSMVGIPSSYNNKVCATVYSPFLTFNISNSSVGFGALTPTGLRYATSDGMGSSIETEAYHLDASTNAPSGYVISVEGSSLANGSTVITPIGGTNITPTAGTDAFGIRALASGGTGAVVSPYNGSGFAYNATGSSYATLASESTGDGNDTTYSIHSVATIDSLLDSGTYSTNMNYLITGGF